MEYCLQAAGTDMDGVDCIAQAWNPGAAWMAFNPLLSRHCVKREDYFYTIPDHLFNVVPRSPDDALSTFFNSGLTRLVLGKYLVCK